MLDERRGTVTPKQSNKIMAELFKDRLNMRLGKLPLDTANAIVRNVMATCSVSRHRLEAWRLSKKYASIKPAPKKAKRSR